jgi:pimeloyl-ACP methyl ester carboxylesterase
MAKFVLVHSMFHGGWSFDKIKPLLEAKGHSVSAPDLAGCGDDKTPAAEVTLDGWAKSIAAIAEASGKVILVGHSRGGVVVSQAAEYAPAHVAASVYVTALMLPNGRSAMNVPEIAAEQGFPAPTDFVAPRMTEDFTAMLPPENAEEVFYAGCSPEIRAWAVPRMGAEPLGPLMTPVALTDERYGTVPKIYIETTEDHTLPIQTQRALIAAVKPDEVITLHTDHMPVMSDAAELADILDHIAKRYAA